MSGFSRRDVLKLGLGSAIIAASGARSASAEAAAPPEFRLVPEKGARLRVLRWKPFVQGEIDFFVANSRRFSDVTGIDVRLEIENWEEVRPKASMAASIGGGPDIIFGTNDDPHLFPDKLVDLSDLAEYLGRKYGGWYDTARSYGTRNKRWIALPQGAAAACLNYRSSHVRAAGFETIPDDHAGLLDLCRKLKKNGTPAGFALGHATGDANVFAHWCLWSHGGRVVDEKNRIVLESPETIAAIEYAKLLHETQAWGTLSWLDANNNKAFLAGEISLTNNGISIYATAKNASDPRLQAIAGDMEHAQFPQGIAGKANQYNLLFQAYLFKYSKFPNAAREYLRFMWEREQYDPWMIAANGYLTQPLVHYEKNPIWTVDRKNTPFRDAFRVTIPNGHAGELGAGSAATLGNFVVVDMFADACSGARTPREAARFAAERARRFYET